MSAPFAVRLRRRAAGICVNGESHGPATDGQLCASCADRNRGNASEQHKRKVAAVEARRAAILTTFSGAYRLAKERFGPAQFGQDEEGQLKRRKRTAKVLVELARLGWVLDETSTFQRKAA